MAKRQQAWIVAAMTAVGMAGWLPPPSLAQSALENVERRVRKQVAQADAPNEEEAEDANQGYLGIIADDHEVSGLGVRITEVMVGGPADKAGLKPGDLVTKIGNRLVRDLADFSKALVDQPPGKKLRFAIEREWEPSRADVTLGRRPPKSERRFAAFGHQPESGDADPLAAEVPLTRDPPPLPAPAKVSLLGVRVDEVDAATQKKLSLPETRGALVASVTEGSPAQIAGVPVGAVIVAFDGVRIGAPSDLKRALDAAGPGKETRLDYYHRGRLIERTVRLAELAPPLEPPPAMDAEGNGAPPDMPAESDRIERLESRIRELEARLAELERRLAVPADE